MMQPAYQAKQGRAFMTGLALVILLIFATSANGQVLTLTDDLLPAATGNSWTYQINDDPDDIVNDTVLPIFQINDNGLTRVKTKPFENDSVDLPTNVFYRDAAILGGPDRVISIAR